MSLTKQEVDGMLRDMQEGVIIEPLKSPQLRRIMAVRDFVSTIGD